MNAFPCPRGAGRALAPALLSLLLAACGSSDDAAPALSPTAAPDAATVAWNAAASIDVLANDSPGAGPIALTSLTAPAHGSATIVDGKLSYQPAAGYFGADSVGYTITDAASGATATATVTITVQAQMKLQGTVADAPLANARVTVRLGTAEFSATADASGKYEAAVTSTDGAEFVVVEAVGAGAQAKVRLMSLVGDTATLAGRASTDGVVAGTAMPALDATHLSTALAVLAARAEGGTMPSTAEALSHATAAVSGGEMLRLATFIRMVAGKGVALPDGVVDTLALLQDPAKLDPFTAQQLGPNRALFDATQAEVLAEAPIAGRLDGLAAATEQTLVYLPPTTFSSGLVTVVAYRSDGTANVVNGIERREARWTRSDATVTLTLDGPIKALGVSAQHPVTGDQYAIEDTMTGFVLRHLTGDTRSGTASLEVVGSQVYKDGPYAGQVTLESASFYGKPQSIGSFIDLSLRLDIEAADVAAGMRLGGIVVAQATPDLPVPRADILRFDSAAAATLEVIGQGVTWSLADRWLTLTRASGERMRYARLLPAAANHLETWIAIAEVAGRDAGVAVTSLVKVDATAAFDAAGAARNWRFADFYADEPYSETVMRAYPDGTLLQDSVEGGVSMGSFSYAWSLDSQARIAMLRYNSNGSLNRDRKWTLLKRDGDNAIVFEFFRFYGSGGVPFSDDVYRIRWLTDLGPATKP